jgi:site-specific recombinase XerD
MTDNTSLAALLPTFISYLEEKGRSPSTLLAYRADLDQLTTFLSKRWNTMPSQIELADLQAFKENLLNQSYAPKSFKYLKKVFTAFSLREADFGV